MADMYGASDRGKSLAIVTLLPYLGPALGPIIGGLITQLVSWRWVFWTMSILDSAILLLGLFIIRETYAPVLLRWEAQKAGMEIKRKSSLKTELMRPIHIMLHRPIIWPISLLGTLAFGVYCLVLSTYATLWIEIYHETELMGSLHYIAIALGTTIAGQIGSRILDIIYRRMSTKSNGEGRPEYRIPYILPGVLLMPIGLVWYGWSAEHKLAWIIVDIGTVIFTLGSFVAAQGVVAYQLDEFAEFSASANAASRVVSYVLAFAFPVFAPGMYGGMGYGWGNGLLGLVLMVLGLPVCWVLWRWGERLRVVGR